MTIVKVSKKKIIRAILDEPLRNLAPGTWIDYNEGDGDLANNEVKDCPVCAVGATMRAIISPDEKMEHILDAIHVSVKEGRCDIAIPTSSWRSDNTVLVNDRFYKAPKTKQDIFDIAKDSIKKFPMASISQVFESLCDLRTSQKDYFHNLSRHQVYRIRKDVAEFVERYFPAYVTLDINGAMPAKDVKVVK
jgi:hypothetical protein